MMHILLLLCLFLIPACSTTAPGETRPADAASAAAAVAIEAVKVEYRDLQRFVEAVGTLDPNEEVTVSSQVEGTLEKLFVDLGDAVRPGQTIAQLDTRELALGVQQQSAALQQELARLGLTEPNALIDEAATSQVRQAEATFEEAKIRLDRVKRLAQEGVLPKQQLDEQQARYEIAEAARRSARETVRNIRATIAARQASLALAEKKLADARIVAPMAGHIKDRLVTEGMYLRSNTPFVTIVQSSPLKLRVEVPEAAIAHIRSGSAVRFTVDASTGRTFEGRITRLAPSVNQQSRTLRLEALVNNADGTLKPGLFARVTIQTERTDKALVVPESALFTFAGLEKLFVVENGKVTERVVRSGTRVNGEAEVVEGVKEGDVVATSNLGNLQHRREVSIR